MEKFLGDYETNKGVRVTIHIYSKSGWCGNFYGRDDMTAGPLYKLTFNDMGECISNFGGKVEDVGKLMRQRKGVEQW